MKKAAVTSFLVALILLAGAVLAEAQQPAKVPRIGLLIASSPSAASPRIEAFRHGLTELGYVEGKNIVIEYRYAEGKPDRLPALAADLVRLKIDIIVTGGTSPTRAAKEATVSIPIVMTQDIDPSRERVCRQSCATWRQYHGIVQLCAGVERETDRAAKGDCS